MGPAPAQRPPGGGWVGGIRARERAVRVGGRPVVMMAAPGRASRALPTVASLRDGLRPPLTPVPPPLLLVEGAAPGAGPRERLSVGPGPPPAAGRWAVTGRGRLGMGSAPAQRPPGGGWCAIASVWARPRLSGHRVVGDAPSARDGPGSGSAATGWWVARRRDRPGMGPAKRPQAGGQDATRGGPARSAAAGRWPGRHLLAGARPRPSGRRPVGRWRVRQARKCPDRALSDCQAVGTEVWRHQSACGVRRASIVPDLSGFVACLRAPSAAWCRPTSDWALLWANRRPSAAMPGPAAPEPGAGFAPPAGLRPPTKAGPLPGLRWGPAPRGRPTLICTSGTRLPVKGGRRPSRSDATKERPIQADVARHTHKPGGPGFPVHPPPPGTVTPLPVRLATPPSVPVPVTPPP